MVDVAAPPKNGILVVFDGLQPIVNPPLAMKRMNHDDRRSFHCCNFAGTTGAHHERARHLNASLRGGRPLRASRAVPAWHISWQSVAGLSPVPDAAIPCLRARYPWFWPYGASRLDARYERLRPLFPRSAR